MTGAMFAYAICFACGDVFGFNPDLVVCLNRRPICEACVRQLNELRAEQHEPSVWVHPDAYRVVEH